MAIASFESATERRVSRGVGHRSARRRAALALLASLLGLAGCGGSAPVRHPESTAPPQGSATASLDGPTLANPAPAPPLVLPDYRHHLISLNDYRGKAVLVTFIYTHCPDTCPLIVSNLHNALALLGRRAGEAQVIGVSVDPKGDTSRAVAEFLGAHEMIGKMKYLVSSPAALRPVWHAWGVDASTPDANERVNHSAMVYGITASGTVVTVYPANFTPQDIAHDVPILASN